MQQLMTAPADTNGAIRTQITLAAVGMTGPVGDDPDGWNARLMDNVTTLMELTSPSGEVGRFVDSMTGARQITGVVMKVERSSKGDNRGVLTFRSDIRTKYNEKTDGVETLRTEQLGSRERPSLGYRHCVALRKLVGHRVAIWIKNDPPREGSESDKGYRVLRHFKDLGPAEAEAAS